LLEPEQERKSGRDARAPRLLRFHLLERLTGDAERIDAARNAGVDRGLRHDLAYLFLGDAVAQCAFDMQLQLVRPVEDADHGDVEHAAGLARETIAPPGGTPAVLGHQLLKRPIE